MVGWEGEGKEKAGEKLVREEAIASVALDLKVWLSTCFLRKQDCLLL